RFAGFVHGLDPVLETPRRDLRPEFAIGIDKDGLRSTRLSPNVADKAAVDHIHTCCADTDNVTSRRKAATGCKTQGRVEAAGGVVKQRLNTDSRVGGAVEVARESL